MLIEGFSNDKSLLGRVQFLVFPFLWKIMISDDEVGLFSINLVVIAVLLLELHHFF